MREIRQLKPENLREAMLIGMKAYPMMPINSDEQLNERVNMLAKDFYMHGREWYGMFEDDVMLGFMVLYDFRVFYYGKTIKARGIGFVAVDFLHKKQKVCKEMLNWFLQDSHAKNYPLAMLYAFRPDFYKQMGFGYGTMCDKYVCSPASFPAFKPSRPMSYLSIKNNKEVMAFFDELYFRHHGMIRKSQGSVDAMLDAPGLHKVGYYDNGKLCALLVFRLIADESTNNTTHMDLDMLFSSPEGLKASFSFLNSQADQVTRISFAPLDPQLFFGLTDIRHQDGKSLREPAFHHTSDSGMGVMYRSLNPMYLLTRKPSTLDRFSIRFVLQDDFCPACPKEFCIRWTKGKAKLSKSDVYDIELKLGVAEFASWVMNAINLETLYQYALLEVSNPSLLPMLDTSFYFPAKPSCLERF